MANSHISVTSMSICIPSGDACAANAAQAQPVYHALGVQIGYWQGSGYDSSKNRLNMACSIHALVTRRMLYIIHSGSDEGLSMHCG
jgi:hypothetical protein